MNSRKKTIENEQEKISSALSRFSDLGSKNLDLSEDYGVNLEFCNIDAYLNDLEKYPTILVGERDIVFLRDKGIGFSIHWLDELDFGYPNKLIIPLGLSLLLFGTFESTDSGIALIKERNVVKLGKLILEDTHYYRVGFKRNSESCEAYLPIEKLNEFLSDIEEGHKILELLF